MGARKIKAATTITQYPRDEIPIRNLRVDPEKFQTRVDTDVATVKHYAARFAAGSPFPDVLVFLIAGVYWLVDGFHRVAAAERLGLKTIGVRIREATEDEFVGPEEQAFLAGLRQNMDLIDAKGYGVGDRKHTVEMMVRNEEFRTWSDTEIGRRCRISPRTVHTIRMRLWRDDGVALPDRVKAFTGAGTWNGRKRAYRYASTTGKPALWSFRREQGSGKFRHKVRIGGKLFDLGTDPDVAARRYTELTEEHSAKRVALAKPSDLSRMLNRRLIHSRVGAVAGFSVVVVPGDVFLVNLPDESQEKLQAAIGKTLLIRKQHPGIRVVVVCYRKLFNGNGAVKDLVLARSEPDPIEFLTPEEVVERFAPKPAATGGEGER